MLRQRFRFFLLAGLGCLALTAFACTSAQTTSGTKGKRAEKDDDIICKYVEPTGSHIPQLVCWERYQLDDRRSNDQERVRNIQIGSGIDPTAGGQSGNNPAPTNQ